MAGCDTSSSLAMGQTPGTDFLSYYDDDGATFLLKSLNTVLFGICIHVSFHEMQAYIL